ncbi:MAG TPA: hypothetical protein DD723_06240 [Candidatus Omnitrophica bacterium]|nr:MAG: hypothetical protein A2Z81_06540 [Omnitrophica WOR_2 bacterium GWA2_45_18]HBR15124.1 hypothetical protein [Candidatus Omnitrophota bacterium]
MIKNKKIFWIAFFILTALAFFMKFYGPQAVESLYAQGAIGFLNKMAGVDTARSLEFYLGKTQETFWGPGSVLLSGLAFLAFALMYLRRIGHWKFGAAVFLYLLATKWEILLYPPYGDSASGPFVEAIWLVHHHFDYIGLAREPGFISGGPKVYLFSIYPTYVAGLMTLIPNVKVFLMINHLLVFAFGAAIVSLLRRISLKFFDATTALLISLLLLSLPLFHSQVEALNMEIPALLPIMGSLYYLVNRRMGPACVMSMLAALVKVYAVIAGATVFVAGMGLYFFDKEHRFKARTLGWSLLAIFFAAAVAYAERFFFHDQWQVSKVGLWEGWKYIKSLKTTHLYFLSVMMFAGLFLKEKRTNVQEPLIFFLRRHYAALVFFLYSGAWFFVFLNSGSMIPRYLLLIAPSMVFLLFYVLRAVMGSEKILCFLVTGLIAFSLFCSYGFPYPPLEKVIHSWLERSLEYRNDIQLQMKLARVIEDKYSDYTIGAPFTIAQTLGLPELGFVTKKLSVMIFDHPCVYGGIQHFRGLQYLDMNRTLWVGFETNVPPPLDQWIEYPVGPQDHVVDTVSVGYRTVKLFLGGFSIEKMRLILIQLIKERG